MAENKQKKKLNQTELITEANKTLLLNSKTQRVEDQSDDSSDEEVLVRTGDVPSEWYHDYKHSGYDINAQKVIKPKEEDQIEQFIKKAEDKNWWRNIFDEKNNSNVYISDKDLSLIKRIINNKFANKQAAQEEYFERDIPYQIHPVSNHMPRKAAFEMSKSERKAINRIVYAIKNGFLKLDEEKLEDKEILYDMWTYENTDPSKYHPGKGFSAPKRDLPDTDESYNPPGVENTPSLRKIPKYGKLFDENLERCCDLVMSARVIRKKLDIKEEDLMPNLPKPEDLKPFPTKENITFKGHESSIRAMCVEPKGKFLISGDNGGFVHIWDIQTAKIIKRIDVSDSINDIAYNPSLNLVTICGKKNVYFLIPHFLQSKLKAEMIDLIKNKLYARINSLEESKDYQWKIPKAGSPKERHGILFYLKWKEGSLETLAWHSKGDYFATLTKNSSGKSQVYIHSLSKMIHQTPFSKIKGTINAISFHPSKPYFLVATNSNIFVYNLQKQVNKYNLI